MENVDTKILDGGRSVLGKNLALGDLINNPALSAVLIYFCFALFVSFTDLTGLFKDIIATPFYLLFPMGVGLFSLGLIGVLKRLEFIKIGFIEFFISAVLLGFIEITYVFIFLESQSLIAEYRDVAIYSLVLLSITGFIWSRRHLRDVVFAVRNFKVPIYAWALLATVLGFAYYMYFFQFYEFPLRDTFQDVHFMKGAREFTKFKTVNPFTADSYLPLLQVNWGILNSFLNYDLFNGQILLPLVLFCMHFLALFIFFNSFIEGRRLAFLCAIAGAATSRFVFSHTTNEVLYSLTFVVFSLLFNTFSLNQKSRHSVLQSLAFFGLFSFIFFFTQKNYLNSTVVISLIALSVLAASFLKSRTPARLAFTLLIMALAVPLHRASAMYIPFAIFFSLFIHLIVNCKKERIPYFYFFMGFRKLAKTYVLAIGVIITIYYWVFIKMVLHFNSEYFSSLPTKIFSVIFNKQISSESLTDNAGGFQNSVVEWIRNIPPVIQFFVGLFVLSIIIMEFYLRKKALPERPWPGQVFSEKFQQQIKLIFALSFIVVITTLTTFSGIPYIHRGQFLITFFFIGLLFVIVDSILELNVSKSRIFKIGLSGLTVIFIFYLAKGFYNFQWDHLKNPNLYLQHLYPVNQIGMLATLVIAGLISVWSVIKPDKKKVGLIFGLIIVSILTDKLTIVVKYYEYGYGSGFPKSKVLSHYTHDEILFAKTLDELPQESIIFSDPYTLSTIKAVTGLNSFYTFENISNINNSYKEVLRNIMYKIGGYDQSENAIDVADALTNFMVKFPGAGPEAAYIYNKKFGLEYQYENIKKNLYLVFTEKSFLWAKMKDTYFPQVGVLERSFVDRQINDKFEVLKNFKNKIILAKIK